MTELALETIDEKFNASFTRNFTGFMLECCVVCLTSQKHKTGTLLNKEAHQSNIIDQDYLLSW